METKIAHLNFIQAIINRMGDNSFSSKGWSIALLTAIFVLAAKDSDSNFIFIAFIPLVLFWMLDSYFLYQEKLYRELFKDVAGDYVPSTKFVLDTDLVKNKVKIWIIPFSPTLLSFHGTLLFIIVITKCYLL